MLAAAAVMSSVVAPYVVSAEAVTTTAQAGFTQSNVDFAFSAGTEADTYLKAFITNANLVVENGKTYAEITLGGHSYAVTAIKLDSATGADVAVTSTTGSAEGKDLVRSVKVELDAEGKTALYLEAGTRGSYTFNFDFIEEKTKFEFATGSGQDDYFSAWVPSADVVTDATGKKFAYVTFAGHSYAIEAFKEGDKAATIISSTGSAEGKDLVRVVRVALDENNKGALTLDGGQRGTYTFSFDFTQKDEVKIEDVLTAEAQAVDFKYSAAVTWHPMAFKANIQSATAKKVNDKYEITLTLADNVTAFTATQDGKELASFKDSKQLTFQVASLQGILFKATATSDRGAAETEVTVDEITLAEATVEVPAEKPTTPEVKNPFTDIDGVYSKDDIIALYNAGITTGTTATTFNPSGTVNRAQFAVMVSRALGVSSNKETAFADVKGKWYAKEVQALAEIGIVKGVNAQTFNPAAPVTRQQAALMIERMLKHKGYTFSTDASSLNFLDAANISSEAKAAFAELQAKGILTGSNGYATPANTLKRAQMAKILNNSLKLLK